MSNTQHTALDHLVRQLAARDGYLTHPQNGGYFYQPGATACVSLAQLRAKYLAVRP